MSAFQLFQQEYGKTEASIGNLVHGIFFVYYIGIEEGIVGEVDQPKCNYMEDHLKKNNSYFRMYSSFYNL